MRECVSSGESETTQKATYWLDKRYCSELATLFRHREDWFALDHSSLATSGVSYKATEVPPPDIDFRMWDGSAPSRYWFPHAGWKCPLQILVSACGMEVPPPDIGFRMQDGSAPSRYWFPHAGWKCPLQILVSTCGMEVIHCSAMAHTQRQRLNPSTLQGRHTIHGSWMPLLTCHPACIVLVECV